MPVHLPRSSQAYAAMIEDNLSERSLYFARHFNGEIHGPNPVWYITGPALPYDNGVTKAKFEQTKLDEGIKTALEPFKSRRLPMRWWVGPSSSPPDLGKYLQRFSLAHNRDMIGMALDMSQLPAPPVIPHLTLEQVVNEKMLEQWYKVLLEGFPISYNRAYFNALTLAGLDKDAAEHHYIARMHGDIVGISTLFLGGGTAGLYNVVTRPAMRGAGIGSWLTVKTFQETPPGYPVATLQTTYPNALRLYHRLGFEVYCKISIYQLVAH